MFTRFSPFTPHHSSGPEYSHSNNQLHLFERQNQESFRLSSDNASLEKIQTTFHSQLFTQNTDKLPQQFINFKLNNPFNQPTKTGGSKNSFETSQVHLRSHPKRFKWLNFHAFLKVCFFLFLLILLINLGHLSKAKIQKWISQTEISDGKDRIKIKIQKQIKAENSAQIQLSLIEDQEGIIESFKTQKYGFRKEKQGISEEGFSGKVKSNQQMAQENQLFGVNLNVQQNKQYKEKQNQKLEKSYAQQTSKLNKKQQNEQSKKSLQNSKSKPIVEEIKQNHQNQQTHSISTFQTNNNTLNLQLTSQNNHQGKNEQPSKPLSNGIQQNHSTYSQNLPYDPIKTCLEDLLRKRQQFGSLYQFQTSYSDFNMLSLFLPSNQQNLTRIDNEQFRQAIDLLGLIHMVSPDGITHFENNLCQNPQLLQKRMTQTLNHQYQRLNSTYQIDHYHSKQLRFCIVSNSYNNAQNGLLYRNIDSILQQNYTNYHVVYTDDASPDSTGEVVREYLKEKGVKDGKFKVKINSEKKGMMENIFNAVTYDCELGEIVVMVDGDDSLIGTNVLSLLNAVFQKQRIAMMWNNFIEIEYNTIGLLGFSREFYDFQINEANFRKRGILLSSHLKSFYVDVFRKIKVRDLQQYSGVFYGGASDTAMMLPMLEMSFPRFKYVAELLYEYRIDTGQLGMLTNREQQGRALEKIQTSDMYQKLTDFSFIDKAILQAHDKTQKQ